MNSTPNTQLDAFETALLADLKQQVADGGVDRASADGRGVIHPLTRTPQPRRRALLVGAVAAAGALAAGIGVQVARPQPAFAISGENGEEVTVRVMRLEGAKALERALHERGIEADVTYLPIEKACASDRYTPVKDAKPLLRVADDWFEVVIPANSMGKKDTFVLAAWVRPLKDGAEFAVDFGVAKGPVRACQVVDAP